jgi:hypothetical protein
MRDLPASHPLAAAYVDLNAMTVLLNCGETIGIDMLLDDEGDECGPVEAVVAIATNGKGWWRVPLDFVSPHSLN